SMREADARTQAFKVADVRIGTLIDALRSGRGRQGGGDRLAPTLATGRRNLQHDGLAVTVGDHTRQSVRFAVDQAATVVACIEHRRAHLDGVCDATDEERGVDFFTLVECPHAGADLRGGRIGGARDERAVIANYVDSITALRRALDRS